jgi:AcrR family transcriptional regulator
MRQAERRYGGMSAEDRRAARRARLLDASLDVLGGQGLANTTMTAICVEAGLTERYFYESFRNLEELLGALFDSVAAEAGRAVDDALQAAPADLLERCRASAGAIIGVLAEDPRKARTFVEAIGSEALRERRETTIRAYAAVLAEQMSTLAETPVRVDEPHLTLVTTMLVGGVLEGIVGWLAGTIALTREQLIEDAARMAVAAAGTLADRR